MPIKFATMHPIVLMQGEILIFILDHHESNTDHSVWSKIENIKIRYNKEDLQAYSLLVFSSYDQQF